MARDLTGRVPARPLGRRRSGVGGLSARTLAQAGLLDQILATAHERPALYMVVGGRTGDGAVLGTVSTLQEPVCKVNTVNQAKPLDT